MNNPNMTESTDIDLKDSLLLRSYSSKISDLWLNGATKNQSTSKNLFSLFNRFEEFTSLIVNTSNEHE